MTASAEAGAACTSPPMRMPDFFIVGQPKSGTTALYTMLASHPQLYMPSLKEPTFMASDLLAGQRWISVRARPRTLDDYRALFGPARAEQRAGEASALYLSSHSAAANIAKLQPAARIIAILREPASLLRSLHLQLLQDHSESESDLRAALSLEQQRRQGRHIPRECARPAALYYSEHVRYVEQLRRYHVAFPIEQVLVLIYDDFRADNAGTVKSVLRFLDVDDTVPIESIDANPSLRVRSRGLDGAVRSVSLGGGALARAVGAPIKMLVPRGVRQGVLQLARRRVLYGGPPPPDEDLTLELRRQFKSEVVALSEYIGRDLVSLWGYDRIG